MSMIFNHHVWEVWHFQNGSGKLIVGIGKEYYERKCYGGKSELRTFTFSLAQRSLCPVGTCVERSFSHISLAQRSLSPVGMCLKRS